MIPFCFALLSFHFTAMNMLIMIDSVITRNALDYRTLIENNCAEPSKEVGHTDNILLFITISMWCYIIIQAKIQENIMLAW